ncbi:MAG: hypothetical protein ABJF11_15030 [Reichenbachiella sp.]|uniref:hypothetical protein n=1 Tax=Reichenbachiella sp. TaxID=2184521 RepID=UPI003265330E
MRNKLITMLALGWALFNSLTIYGQTENYKKGLAAIQANRYHEAMICFTKVVTDEKFEITGKDLSMGYAYLAVIRTAYLEKGLQGGDFASITLNQGQIQQALSEMTRAVKFQDNASKSLLKNARPTLEEISLKALYVVGDSLLEFNENQPNESSSYLADIAVKLFSDLDQLISDNWKFYDTMGLAYYHLGDKENAMGSFQKAREAFAKLEEQPVSQLHLRNYILSGNYFFKEKNNMKVAYQISNEGSSYTSALINQLDDSQMSDILKLNKIENRFRQYMTRIEEAE